MSISSTILRTVTGAYILQSGWGKKDLPTEAYAGLQDFAATGVPQVKQLDADTFGKALAYGEVALGAALVTPFFPKRLAGLGLGAFSAGLLAMYFRNPVMTQEDGIRPTEAGLGLSKDILLAAIAAALVVDK